MDYNQQQPIPLPPATEADFLAGRAACIALMKPDRKGWAEVEQNTFPAAFKWKSKTHPNLTDRQLAAEAKNAQPKK